MRKSGRQKNCDYQKLLDVVVGEGTAQESSSSEGE
jgi:hypothetical protein